MQAILTKILPTTASLPTRIKAECSAGSLVATLAHLNGTDAEKHQAVARGLCVKLAGEARQRAGNSNAGKEWLSPMVCGQLPNGDYCHVFLS